MSMYDKQIEKLETSLDGAFIAGGALTSVFMGKPVNDYDFYFKSNDALIAGIKTCYAKNYWCASVTHRAVTFLVPNGPPVQLMLFRTFDTPTSIFDSFDFTCCMAAYDCDSKEVHLHEDFLLALAKRELKFNHRTAFPIASQLRVPKYMERGFTIERSEFLKLAIACSGIQLNSWDDLKHQIGGVYGDRTEIAERGEFSVETACLALSKSPLAPTESERMAELESSESLLRYLAETGVVKLNEQAQQPPAETKAAELNF